MNRPTREYAINDANGVLRELTDRDAFCAAIEAVPAEQWQPRSFVTVQLETKQHRVTFPVWVLK